MLKGMEEGIKLVQLALKALGCNDAIVPNGRVGEQEKKAVAHRQSNFFSADDLVFLCQVYRRAGFNDDLAFNTSPSELVKAEKAFLERAEEPLLFLGFHHVGLQARADGTDSLAKVQAMSDWYARLFGFDAKKGSSSVFISGPEFGQVEAIFKSGSQHLAVGVSDFEAAMDNLRTLGVTFTQVIEKPGVKAVYLTEQDPIGTPVHLFWKDQQA